MAKQDALENVVELNPDKSWANIINLAVIHILYIRIKYSDFELKMYFQKIILVF